MWRCNCGEQLDERAQRRVARINANGHCDLVGSATGGEIRAAARAGYEFVMGTDRMCGGPALVSRKMDASRRPPPSSQAGEVLSECAETVHDLIDDVVLEGAKRAYENMWLGAAPNKRQRVA